MEAGSGNRTRMASLEGWSFAIKLYPRSVQGEISIRHAKRQAYFFFATHFFIFVSCFSSSLDNPRRFMYYVRRYLRASFNGRTRASQA